MPDTTDLVRPRHEIGHAACLFSETKPEKGAEWRGMFGAENNQERERREELSGKLRWSGSLLHSRYSIDVKRPGCRNCDWADEMHYSSIVLSMKSEYPYIINNNRPGLMKIGLGEVYNSAELKIESPNYPS